MVLFQWVLQVIKAHKRIGGTHRNIIMRILQALEHPKKDQEQPMFGWCQLIDQFQSCNKISEVVIWVSLFSGAWAG